MTQLPKIQPKGELQITDADLKKHASDLLNKIPQMGKDIGFVRQIKPQLDSIMQPIAQETGADFSSRVKNPEMIIRKVVQKRMEDRNYQLSDINDLYGARFVVRNDGDIAKVKKAVEDAAKKGVFHIIKGQERDKDTYHAYHFDLAFPLPNGKTIRCECQIMTQSSEAQAAVTHDAHAEYSDTPPQHVQKKLDKETKTIDQMPHIKQKQVADTMLTAHKINNDKPLPHGFARKVIANVKNR